MKIKWLMVLSAVMLWTVGGNPSMILAQEVKKGKGFVTKNVDNQLILKEYNQAEKNSLEVVYAITADTKFNNFQSLNDILEYDVLEIEYRDDQGQRTALSIFKSFPVQELLDQLEYDPETLDDIQEISDEYRA